MAVYRLPLPPCSNQRRVLLRAPAFKNSVPTYTVFPHTSDDLSEERERDSESKKRGFHRVDSQVSKEERESDRDMATCAFEMGG